MCELPGVWWTFLGFFQDGLYVLSDVSRCCFEELESVLYAVLRAIDGPPSPGGDSLCGGPWKEDCTGSVRVPIENRWHFEAG